MTNNYPFSTEEVHLGVVQPGSVVPWSFEITEPNLVIKSLKSSCGCTAPIRDGSVIKGEITIGQFPGRSQNQEVEQKKTITIVTQKDRKMHSYTVPIVFKIRNPNFNLDMKLIQDIQMSLRPHVGKGKELRIAYDFITKFLQK